VPADAIIEEVADSQRVMPPVFVIEQVLSCDVMWKGTKGPCLCYG
jgi:hypothetical protein